MAKCSHKQNYHCPTHSPPPSGLKPGSEVSQSRAASFAQKQHLLGAPEALRTPVVNTHVSESLEGWLHRRGENGSNRASESTTPARRSPGSAPPVAAQSSPQSLGDRRTSTTVECGQLPRIGRERKNCGVCGPLAAASGRCCGRRFPARLPRRVWKDPMGHRGVLLEAKQ